MCKKEKVVKMEEAVTDYVEQRRDVPKPQLQARMRTRVKTKQREAAPDE